MIASRLYNGVSHSHVVTFVCMVGVLLGSKN